MDANWSICSIGLFALDAFDVDYEFLAVHLDNFSNCVAFVVTTDNLEMEFNRTNDTLITCATFDFPRGK